MSHKIKVGNKFEEGDTILDALNNARVFSVEKNSAGEFEFAEGCDNWFGATLTRKQVLILAKELIDLAS